MHSLAGIHGATCERFYRLERVNSRGLSLAIQGGLDRKYYPAPWEPAQPGGLLTKLTVILIAETLMADNRRYKYVDFEMTAFVSKQSLSDFRD